MAIARIRGFEIHVLGNPPPGTEALPSWDWRLGKTPPEAAWAGVTAVIHLAHSWSADAVAADGRENANVTATEALARAALARNVGRFVYVSSISSRNNALNCYGRGKFRTETRLIALPAAAGRVYCARVGLVYGGAERGQFGMMARLARLAPILPVVCAKRIVQPIALDDVCAGLLTLATREPPPRPTLVLAAARPIRFGDWLRLLRRTLTGRGLVLLPVPLWLALFLCDLTRHIPYLPTIGRERVLGLAGMQPVENAEEDLATLGIVPADAEEVLSALRAGAERGIRISVRPLPHKAGGDANVGSPQL